MVKAKDLSVVDYVDLLAECFIKHSIVREDEEKEGDVGTRATIRAMVWLNWKYDQHKSAINLNKLTKVQSEKCIDLLKNHPYIMQALA